MIPVTPATAVPALERALTVLEMLAHSDRGFNVSEVSRRLYLPKSSTHVILTTLERRGYLRTFLARAAHVGKLGTYLTFSQSIQSSSVYTRGFDDTKKPLSRLWQHYRGP